MRHRSDSRTPLLHANPEPILRGRDVNMMRTSELRDPLLDAWWTGHDGAAAVRQNRALDAGARAPLELLRNRGVTDGCVRVAVDADDRTHDGCAVADIEIEVAQCRSQSVPQSIITRATVRDERRGVPVMPSRPHVDLATGSEKRQRHARLERSRRTAQLKTREGAS
jgi:hypothetical protein